MIGRLVEIIKGGSKLFIRTGINIVYNIPPLRRLARIVVRWIPDRIYRATLSFGKHKSICAESRCVSENAEWILRALDRHSGGPH